MKLKNCVAQLDRILARKVLAFSLFEIAVPNVCNKVHGIKQSDLKLTYFLTLKMTRN